MDIRLPQIDYEAAWGVNIRRLLVLKHDAFEFPRGAGLPTLGGHLELVFVFPLESGKTQAILFSNFGLQDDLQLLREHLVSVPCVRVVNDLAADDLELDFT